jgi:YD repeat-containing protein
MKFKWQWAVLVILSAISSRWASATLSITSLTPTSGAVGTSVTIKGTGFGTSQGTSTVTFNGTPGTPTTWANTSIKVPVPAGATTGNVVVTVGVVPSNGESFTVLPTPSITSLTPSSDPVGAVVTISGTNFGVTQGSSTVVFDRTTATPTMWSNTSIQVPVPTGAATGNVVITVNGVASTGVSFTVLPTPSITSLTPTSGAVGASVTIKGTSFGSSQGASAVTFNGTPGTPTNWANTSIKVPVPASTTTGYVVVTVNGVPSNGVSFIVPGTTATISALSPTSDAVGAQVSINGSNFGSTRGSNTVTFNGTTAAPTSWSATNIVTPVPSGATTGAVVVTVGGVSSNGESFTVLGTPSITNLSPTSGAVGSSVTITGTNFGSMQGSVSFNGTTAATIGSWSATSIVATVPSGTTTGNVVVNANGVQSNAVLFTVAAPSNGPISYTYDALGRLIGVVDALGNGATYSYDAVGNILLISRVNAGQVSIIGFSPTTGPIGTTVTISGTGFSTTASQDTVQFNGVAATVTSATATQIITSVPSGANTGAIGVTAPGGSANSGSSFTVTSSVGLPQIASFTPSIATALTSIAITGSNFDPVVANDRVGVNGIGAVASSATNSSLLMSVPTNAGSGRVSLSTPEGNAVAASDLFVVPPPYTVGQVGFTGRAVLGTATAINLSSSQSIGLLLFDAQQGQSVYITTNSESYFYNAELLYPNNSWWLTSIFGGSYYQQSVNLPVQQTGGYALLIDSEGNNDNYQATVYVSDPVTQSVTLNGEPVSIQTNTPGQIALLTFTASAGQMISITGNVSLSNEQYGTVALYAPDNSVVATFEAINGSFFAPATPLPLDGMYQVYVYPYVNGNTDPQQGTFSFNFQFYSVPPDPTASASIGGGPVTVTTTVPGENDIVTFSGTAGQTISITGSTSFSNEGFGTVILSAPDSSLVATYDAYNGSFFADATTLPLTGTYQLYFDPLYGSVGSLTLDILAVPPNPILPASVDGGAVTIVTTVPGENASVTFTGTAGEELTLDVLNGYTETGASAVLYAPDGSFVDSFAIDPSIDNTSSYFQTALLPASGTYTLIWDPTGAGIGAAVISISSVPANSATTLTVDGGPASLTTVAAGQQAEFTFAGTGGQTVSISGTTTISTPYYLLGTLAVYAPSGTQIFTTGEYTGNPVPFFVSPMTLSESGNYEVLFTPNLPLTGSVTIDVRSVPADAIVALTDGTPATLTITAPGQSATATFTGTAGQNILIIEENTLSLEFPPPALFPWNGFLNLYSAGTLIQSWSLGSIGLFEYTLPNTGNYSFGIDAEASTGTITLGYQSMPADVTASSAIDGPPVTVQPSESDVSISFNATLGQTVTISGSALMGTGLAPLNGTNVEAFVELFAPDGTFLASSSIYGLWGSSAPVSFFVNATSLPQSGTYQIQVEQTEGLLTSVTVLIQSVPANATAGPAVVDGSPVTVTTTAPGQDGSVSIPGTAGQRVFIAASGSLFNTSDVALVLYAPDGSYVSSGASGYIAATTFTTTGTYTLSINPLDNSVGSAAVQVTSVPANVTAAGTVNGGPVTVTTTAPSQNAVISFPASANTIIAISGTGTLNGDQMASVELDDPTGSQVATFELEGTSPYTNYTTVQLAVSGTYQLSITPDPPAVGTMALSVGTIPAPATATAAINGGPATITTTTVGQWGEVTFAGTAGQTATISASSEYPGPGTEGAGIIGPDGSVLNYFLFDSSSPGSFPSLLLPITGTYSVILLPETSATGSMSVTITQP